ncbi:hypothetical protein V1511DRAFT_461433 [Dipodascopsis uninucleata]
MTMTPKSFKELPSYDELENKHQFWVWGSPGSREEGLGMLNLLTPEHIAKSAASEIRSGERVSLGWEFHNLDYPPFNRINFDMKIKPVSPEAFDDEYHINPQQSSQWDGFRHHSQPGSYSEGDEKVDEPLWFGGTTRKEIYETDRIGIHHWAKQGIVTRGVLVDYAAWAELNDIKYSSFEKHIIPLEHIKATIEHFKVEIKPGDLLFVRIGLIKEWENMNESQRKAYQAAKVPMHAGLEETDEMLRWIWNNHFVAVASDAVSWEIYPIQNRSFSHHYHLLAGWGMPIGEMFDLEGLSELCHKLNRFSFFVSSVPFNAVGGVSSPPNAVAIF